MEKTVLTKEEIFNICLSLSVLLRSGVTPGDAFDIMSDSETVPERETILSEMSSLSDEGYSVARIFKEVGIFPKYVEGLIDAGEKTGRLEEALASLATFYEGRISLERNIRSSLLYPMLLLVIMMLVIGVLLVKVMPVFESVYNQLGSGLTGIAGGLLKLGEVMDKAMPLILVILILFVAFAAAFAFSPKFREMLGRKWNKCIGHKGIAGKLNTAKIAQVVSMGIRSGMSIDETFELASELMVDVPVLSEKCKKCADDASLGMSLAEAIKKNELFPVTECRILEAALKGGLADEVIEDIAKRLMVESEEAFEMKISRIEPALVIATSFMVGIILLSVVIPLVNIMASIG